MDKYQKLKAVQGLIMSLDEQIYRNDQNKVKEEEYEILLNKYYKSILEFLQKEENTKKQKIKSYVINVNGVANAFHEETINWEQVIGLTNLLYGDEILTITYSHGDKDKPQGTLDVNEVIKVKDKMIFNVVITTGA